MESRIEHYRKALTFAPKSAMLNERLREMHLELSQNKQPESNRLSKVYCDEMETILSKYYYFRSKDEILESYELQQDMKDHVVNRYVNTLNHYIPWVSNIVNLSKCDLVEIGSGTGSSSAAFSSIVRNIYAYEISKNSVKIAQKRVELLNIKNVKFTQIEPENILNQIRDNHPLGISAILIFAVLEHMTIPERINTLKTAWELLNPGGILIVAETPNRLTYYDHHTSWLPFFHMLPLELAVLYAEQVPRGNVAKIMRSISSLDLSKRIQALTRLGNGVSFHEFELALENNLDDLIIANGNSPEMRALYPITREESILNQYFVDANVKKPQSFCNAVLNLIFQKPMC